MSTLAELREAIKAVVCRISGHAHVVWRDERAEFPADGVVVKLHTRSFATVGTPEQRQRDVLVDGGDTITGEEVKTDVVEQRTFTLAVLVESFDQTATAQELAGKIRARLYRPYALGALRDVNCAVLKAEASTDLPTTYDKRIWSAVAFDVRLGWATVDAQEDFDAELTPDEVTDATGYIEIIKLNTGAPYGESVIDLGAPAP